MDEPAAVVEVELTPKEGAHRKTQLRTFGGGIAIVAALLIGAMFATSDDPESVDVTATQDDESDSEDTSDTTDEPDVEPVVDDDVSEDTDRDLPADEESDDAITSNRGDGFGEFAAAEDSAYYGGSDGAIFDGSRFISIGYSESGQTLRTSDDGLTWSETPVTALPANSNVYQLAEHNGTVIAVVEQWNDDGFREGTPEAFFGPVDGPTHYLASSTDLETWTLTELPVPAADDGPVFLSVNGIALNDAGVVLFTQAHSEGGDEMRLLFDAGIIDTDDLDRYCGIDFAEDDVYEVQLCDHEGDEWMWEEFEAALEAATTDEERREVELEFEENFVEPVPEVIATISTGDPLHDELHAIFTDQGSEPTSTILTGPVTGPFTQTELDIEGHPAGLVEVDGTFVTILQQWNRETSTATTTVLRSTDGRSWDDVGSLPEGDIGRLFAVGSNLLVIGGDDEGQPLSLLSTDLGASWTIADITTNLFGAYPDAAVGPVGVVVIMQGSTEPYPEWTSPPPIEVERDGFVMSITYGDEDGQVTLHDADGNLIYSLREYEMYETGSEGVVRVSRLTGLPTFLDPETGEDLVSFTQDDYEAAHGVFEDEPQEEFGFGIEILFSTDAVTFTPLTDPRLDIETTRGNIQLVGVGDDEVIFVKHTWVEPPATLFALEEDGRDPTEAEEQALEAWFSENGGENAIDYIRVEVG
jgi:hypothetical protein